MTRLGPLIVGLSTIFDAKFHGVIQAEAKNYLAKKGSADLRAFYEFVRSIDRSKESVIEEILLTPS
ncbi:MAG: hypothetical protein ACP5N5_06125 [Desulfurococcus sp.]|uniref:hypothetical protein n=1 Tax=Desulfurococcus sp. TaxID=51678 RepID=UPI003D0BC636